MRASIERIPLLGPLVAGANRRAQKICTPGLHWKQRIRLVPLLGPIVAWLYALVRLDAQRRQTAQELAEFRQSLSLHLEQFDALNIGDRLDRFDAMNIGNRLHRLDALNIGNRLNRLDVLDIANRLNAFDTINIANRLYRIDETLGEDHARGIERDNRIAWLTRELRGGAQPAAAAGIPQAAAVSFDAEGFYLEFENLFRGSREEIKNRLRVYLPRLAHLAGDADARVLDIGCGRGEWLELLAEQGVNVTGIDLNSAMVSACRARGFAAECTDAVAYLRRQPEGSVAVVTGFHLIEHLPFETLVALFDAAQRALRQDGLIIFETPNPENIAVGACSFYTDPTHQRPIIPAVVEFIAKQRGFARTEILRLHPCPDACLLPEDGEMARRINKLLYGPQDYAVLAWKTHAG